MKKFIFILLLLCFCLGIGSCGKNSNFDASDTSNIYAQIVLTNGDKINLRLYRSKAPITVDNFVNLAEEGFYNGTIFHRVIDNFMIQGGGYYLSNGKPVQKTGVSSIYGEFSSNGWTKNDIKHETGVISMARTTVADSATSQFFICSSDDVSYLDGNYAAFGKITDTSSKKVILKLAAYETYSYSSSLQNYPKETIKIKQINLANSAF